MHARDAYGVQHVDDAESVQNIQDAHDDQNARNQPLDARSDRHSGKLQDIERDADNDENNEKTEDRHSVTPCLAKTSGKAPRVAARGAYIWVDLSEIESESDLPKIEAYYVTYGVDFTNLVRRSPAPRLPFDLPRLLFRLPDPSPV